MPINYYDLFWKHLNGWILEAMLDQNMSRDKWQDGDLFILAGTQGKDWRMLKVASDASGYILN